MAVIQRLNFINAFCWLGDDIAYQDKPNLYLIVFFSVFFNFKLSLFLINCVIINRFVVIVII